MTAKRLVYICDWLAAGLWCCGAIRRCFSRGNGQVKGWAVTLVGLTSGPSGRDAAGCRWAMARLRFSASIVALTRSKSSCAASMDHGVERALAQRSLQSDVAGGFGAVYRQSAADVAFHCAAQSSASGSKLIYRITDFHPECLIAERGRTALFFAYCCVSPGSGDAG